MSRPSNLSSILICISLLMAFMMACGSKQEVTPRGFYVIETTIEDIHEAYRSGNLTCRELVEIYLERIDKYDKSTRLNAIVVVNQDALKTADELDKEFQRRESCDRFMVFLLSSRIIMKPMICRRQGDRWLSVGLFLRTMPIRSESFVRQGRSCWSNPTWQSGPSALIKH